MELFGLKITKVEKAEDISAALVPPSNDDGAQDTASSFGGLNYGVYMDTSGSVESEFNSIQTYRQIAQYPEIDVAIQDIVNEAIPHETASKQIEIMFNEDADYSDQLKDSITEEFDRVMELLNYGNISSDIFRQWYVDGRLSYQILVDKENLSRGIIELRQLDPLKIRKVREINTKKTPQGVDAIEAIEEYFLYNNSGFATQNKGASMAGMSPAQGSSGGVQTGIKLSADSVIFVPSGLFDTSGTTVIGHLQKATRPINQLRMMEDAMVITRIARAPERRLFYIDVGSLPKAKAEQYVKDIMNQYRNKMVYNASTGAIEDTKKYMSMLEDIFIPQRESKGTKVETLPGMTAQSIDDTEYFKERVYQALNIPISRLQQDSGFSIGRSTEVSRDEVKFQKFIDKLRRKFGKLFYDTLRTQLILKGVCNNIEWEEIRQNITFQFQKDNAFAELKDMEILQAKLVTLQQVDQYLGKYFSKEYVFRHILNLSDEEINRMQEQIDSEKSDPTAQPTIPGMPPGGMPFGGVPGQDPSMGGQPPFGQPDPNGDEDFDPNAQQQQ